MKKNTALFAVFVALAFIFSYVEMLLPLPFFFPGMKLGLANLVIVIVLYKMGFFSAFGVAMVRNVLIAITFGNFFTFLYSLLGSLISLCIMGLLYRRKNIQVITVSAAGGIGHNLGQFLVAVGIVGGSSLIHYLPFLYFGGLISGLLIGYISYECLKRLPLLNNKN